SPASASRTMTMATRSRPTCSRRLLRALRLIVCVCRRTGCGVSEIGTWEEKYTSSPESTTDPYQEVRVVPRVPEVPVVLVLTTVPDDASAEVIARTLVEERLAACVNLLPPMMSIYRWKGAVERDAER